METLSNNFAEDEVGKCFEDLELKQICSSTAVYDHFSLLIITVFGMSNSLRLFYAFNCYFFKHPIRYTT